VLLARRLTPAGTAPGPLPHPVVLVRMHAGTRPADVLAYQLGAALDRAGTPASVEVLPADGPVPAYHAAALDVAVELRGEEADELPWRPVPAPQADRDEAVTIAPVTVAPVTVAPVAERHALAPPVDPPARQLVEPADRPTEEAHPLAHRDPEPAPERPAADVLARHTPSAPARRHSNQHGLESGAPHRRRDVEPPAAEPARNEDSAEATEQLQSAGGRLPEREAEGSESATEQLRVEPGRGDRRDEHRDNDRRAHRRGYADYDRDDDADDDEHDDLADFPDAAREDDRDDDRADLRGDFRGDFSDDFSDDFRDGSRNGHEPAEEVFPEPLSPHPLAAPRPLPPRDESRPARPTPLPTPPHTPVRSSDTRSRPPVTPISRPAVANPIPMVRRGGPAPIPRPLPVTEPRPAVRRLDDGRDDGRDDLERVADERAERPAVDRRPPRQEDPKPPQGETPAFDSLSDPLNGPLHQPLLAPLLDPTRPEDDPLGLTDRRPAPAEPQDDEWSEEWLSGTWAMAPSALDERADVRPEPKPDPTDDVESSRPAPRPVPRPPARHRFTDEPATANGFPDPVRGQADEGDDASEQAETGDHEPDRPELGLRPDSIARLSDADRQLLARLQAELLEGRRQRIGRRITNGTRATTNGSHHGPPDFAG
jgi:hypothetical protein